MSIRFIAEARKARSRRTVKMTPGGYLRFAAARREEQAKRATRCSCIPCSPLPAIVLLLSLVFVTSRHVLLVLANLPFALVGGVLARLRSAAARCRIGSLVGFVTLFGISTRNSIMLISHYEHLVEQEGAPWNLETAMRGAGERLVADPHDRARHRARRAAARHRQRRSRPRDRRPDGASSFSAGSSPPPR